MPSSPRVSTVAEGMAGLPGNHALLRLLEHRGQPQSLQALEEAMGHDFSESSLLEELHAQGFDARMVELQPEDLGHLQLPTLARAGNGTWILLLKRVPGGWQIERSLAGPELMTTAALAGFITAGALDLGPALRATGSLWRRLGHLLPSYRGVLLKAAAVTAAAQALALVAPWLTGIVVDKSLSKGLHSLLGILCVGLMLAAFFKAWAGWLKDTTLLAFSTRFELTLEKGLFEHLLHLPFPYLQGKTLGELLQTFAGLRRTRTIILEQGLGALFSGLSASGYLIYMFCLLPGPAALVVLFTTAVSLLALGVGYLGAREEHKEVLASEKEYSALMELLTGAATLKATGSQTWALGRWSQRLRQHLAAILRRDRLALRFEVGYGLLGQGVSSTVLIWGGQRVLAGELSLGSLLIFVQLSSAFTLAVLTLAQAVVSYLFLRPQILAVRELFATERVAGPGRHTPGDLRGPVIVDDLWFRYTPESPWILQGRSLQVEPGTFHHLEGPSGSGKSTLLKLLGGLYLPESGRISIGGLDTTAATGFVAFLPQFPQLYSGSILENLRIFSGESDQDRLVAVARQTGLDAWVSTLPMGYFTVVANGGANFSGGQRQLLALTAVLASPRPILLLDEAMSNLDWVSRRRILTCPHFQGRTVIYSSHEEILTDA